LVQRRRSEGKKKYKRGKKSQSITLNRKKTKKDYPEKGTRPYTEKTWKRTESCWKGFQKTENDRGQTEGLEKKCSRNRKYSTKKKGSQNGPGGTKVNSRSRTNIGKTKSTTTRWTPGSGFSQKKQASRKIKKMPMVEPTALEGAKKRKIWAFGPSERKKGNKGV